MTHAGRWNSERGDETSAAVHPDASACPDCAGRLDTGHVLDLIDGGRRFEAQVKRVLGTLGPKERDVLARRFGKAGNGHG